MLQGEKPSDWIYYPRSTERIKYMIHITYNNIQIILRDSMDKHVLLALFTVVCSNCLNIPRCGSSEQPIISHFTYTENGSIDTTTKANLCYDDYFLYVNWYCEDKEVISNFLNCNDPLFKEDAVEIFIATSSSFPQHYFEFEVSPRGVLFFADISNPNLTCQGISSRYYSCTGAQYSGKLTARGWDATLKVGLKVIGRGKKVTKLMGNVFRIDKNSREATRYLSYIPTMSSPPCFHQPLLFDSFELV